MMIWVKNWTKRKLTVKATKSEEHKRKQSETMKRLYKEKKLISPTKGKHMSEEAKKKLSETKKRLYKEGKIKSWSKGLTKSDHPSLMNTSLKQKKIKKGKGLGKENFFYGKHHSEESLEKMRKPKSEEHKRKLSIVAKNRKVSDITKQEMSNRLKERWKNPEYRERTIRNSLKGLMKRPTSFEQKISDLCFKYNLPFIYKGDGSFLINYKNPDFVNEKDKIVIEVFYSWFKIRDYGNVKNYKEFCRRKYEPKGWRVIFIDELDLSADNWEEVCLKKINDMMIEIKCTKSGVEVDSQNANVQR